jgi:hypothetical protein
MLGGRPESCGGLPAQESGLVRYSGGLGGLPAHDSGPMRYPGGLGGLPAHDSGLVRYPGGQERINSPGVWHTGLNG